MNLKTTFYPAPTLLRAAACVAAVGFGHVFAAQTTVRENDRESRRATDERQASPVGDNDVRTGDRVRLKNPDKNFVERVARISMEQASVSRVASERTSNPRVRAFADAMAADHAAISTELSAIAADKGVVLPAKEAVGEKWLKRNAKSFDLDYLKKMVSDHEDTLELFQKQAREGNDPELVAFARKHLAALQQHLNEASDLLKMMKD